MLDQLEDICPGQSQFGYLATPFSLGSTCGNWLAMRNTPIYAECLFAAAGDLGPPQRLSNYAKLVERTG
jgi:hypothetical protein